MNIEELRAEFEAWAVEQPILMCLEDVWSRDRITGEYEYPVMEQAWLGYQAGRAALPSQATEAFPCRIVEADFETGTVTLEMQGDYTVSSGQKYLCDAPLQSQDREDAARIEFLEKEWFYRNTKGVWAFCFSETWEAGQHDSLREAIDHARRVEGDEE